MTVCNGLKVPAPTQSGWRLNYFEKPGRRPDYRNGGWPL